MTMTLCGAWDAPVAWLWAVREGMEAMGFLECKATTEVLVHPVRDIRVVTHVDDFLVSGELHDIAWCLHDMAKTYELKVQIVGWEQGDDRELSVLGRSNRTTTFGVEIEGYENKQHVQILEE